MTGGASGMGASHVRSLAGEGAKVAITDIASDAGTALADELQAAGHEASYHRLDVSDRDAWRQVVADVESAHGPIDVLVNNAGVQVRSAGIEADDREWDLVTSVNQRGVFLGMSAVIPGMVDAWRRLDHQHRIHRSPRRAAGIRFPTREARPRFWG